ncbi:hypothetical protein [Methylobacterium sp. JK268]
MSVVLLLSRQRSGTGALVSVIERHPAITYAGEVLDSHSALGSFSKWIDTNAIHDLKPENMHRRFADFMDTFRSDEKVHIIDIKYNFLNMFSPPSYGMREAPWILEYFASIPAPIINLRRRNLLDAYVSGKLAELNGAWHITDHGSNYQQRLTINIPDFAAFLRNAVREDRFFADYFTGYTFSKVIYYEEIFTDEHSLSEECLRELSDLLSIDLTHLDKRPRFCKQVRGRSSEKIENIDEVIEFFGCSRL